MKILHTNLMFLFIVSVVIGCTPINRTPNWDQMPCRVPKQITLTKDGLLIPNQDTVLTQCPHLNKRSI
jgi:hypothetical protein